MALIGLGPHGEMLADAKYLIKAGALLSVYDLKSEARLKSSLVYLRSVGLANYVCGSIPPDDLLDMDVIILSHEYPRESSFLKLAVEKGVPIEYPETLFFRLAPPVTVVGIMGACGKSTIMSMLAPMLDAACASSNQSLFVMDPDGPDGALVHLKKAKSGDLVLIRITESMMPELVHIRVSPHVAVFTTVPGPSAYIRSPFEILAYQTYNNFIVASDAVIDAVRCDDQQPKAKMLRTKASVVIPDWKVDGRGKHDRDNAALAVETARLFKVEDEVSRRILETWKSLKGRLEQPKKVKSVEVWNDSASVTSLATEAALREMSADKKTVLVLGGARTSADYRELYSMLPRYVHTIVLLPGSGTMKERQAILGLEGVDICSASSLEDAARMAIERAKKGDRILFSPGFEAKGYEASRKERGERFMKAVKSTYL